MQFHPWVISSWPIIERPSEVEPAIAKVLHHLGTVLSADCDEFGRLLGHTFWGDTTKQVGVAWDWTETLDGVFALSDPMGVVSNIQFIDSTGTRVTESLAAVHLAHIAHVLPWQQEVVKVTRSRRSAAPWNKRLKPPADYRFRPSELGGFALSR